MDKLDLSIIDKKLSSHPIGIRPTVITIQVEQPIIRNGITNKAIEGVILYTLIRHIYCLI